MKRQTLTTPLRGARDMAHIREVLRRANSHSKSVGLVTSPLEQSITDLRMQVSELDSAVRQKCNGG